MTTQYEDLRSPRFQIEQIDGREDIIVPAVKNWFAMLFLPVWLCGWTFGGFSAGSAFLRTGQPFLAIWLCAWALGEAYVSVTLVWMVSGVEILRVIGSDLEVGYRILGYERSKLYRGSEIRNLSTQSVPFWNRCGQMQMPFFSSLNRMGSVKFDYGARTIYAAAGLDEAEAHEIIGRLAKRLPKTATAQDLLASKV